MTLTVRMRNEGNQPGDTVQIRGMKPYPAPPLMDPDAPAEMHVEVTGDPEDVVTLFRDQEVTFVPPTEHYDDFVDVGLKGKH